VPRILGNPRLTPSCRGGPPLAPEVCLVTYGPLPASGPRQSRSHHVFAGRFEMISPDDAPARSEAAWVVPSLDRPRDAIRISSARFVSDWSPKGRTFSAVGSAFVPGAPHPLAGCSSLLARSAYWPGRGNSTA